MDNKIDINKIPQELKDKMLEWEKAKPENRTVAVLESINTMLEEVQKADILSKC